MISKTKNNKKIIEESKHKLIINLKNKAEKLLYSDENIDFIINNKNEDINIKNFSNLTLDFCRRSLLPQRYSRCVVALSSDLAEISTPEALEICISAEAYPESLFPPSKDE